MVKGFLNTALNRATNGIANAAGGKGLVDYASTKIAQRRNPTLSIPQTTSGKDALKSGAQVAGTVASLAGGAGLSRALAKRLPTRMRIPGQKKPMKISYGGKGRTIGNPPTWDEGGW